MFESVDNVVTNNVMTTRYITLLAGTSNAMTTSVTTMQILLKLTTVEGVKIAFKRSYDKQNLTLVIISYVKCIILAKGSFNKILFLSHDVTSGSEITPCNKIGKPLVVYRLSNVT